MKILDKIKKGLKSAWQFMDGKKTEIGGLVTGATMIVNGIKPDLMGADVYNGLLIIFGVLFGTGAVHKIVKNENKNQTIGNAAKAIGGAATDLFKK